METFFAFQSFVVVCVIIGCIAFMAVLSMPQSHMRNVLLATACLLYVISPIDLIPELIFGPFGLLDDLVVLMIGVIAAKSALNSNPAT